LFRKNRDWKKGVTHYCHIKLIVIYSDGGRFQLTITELTPF
jgi:hypothetical protein